MKKFLILCVALFLGACSFAGPAPGGLFVVPADGGTLSRQYHNAPVTLSGFDADRNLKLSLGGVNDPIAGTIPEYYWLTNAGDPTKKPRLIFTASNPGYMFFDAATGTRTDSVTVPWGQTVTISQESASQKEAKVVRYSTPEIAGGLVPVATVAAVGGIKAGGDLAVNADGVATIAPTAAPVLAGSTVMFKTNAARVIGNVNSSKSAPTTLDYNSVYFQLGEREYNQNSYRLLGFGFRYTNTNPPAYIGYQETNEAGGTSGDLIMGTRPGVDATAAMPVNMRIRSDGQIMAATGYVPKDPLALTNKAYVDAASAMPAIASRALWQKFSANGSYSAAANGSTLMIAGAVTAISVGLNTAGKMPDGGSFDIVNFGSAPVVVTFADKASSAGVGVAATLTIPVGKAFKCTWGTGGPWYCW